MEFALAFALWLVYRGTNLLIYSDVGGGLDHRRPPLSSFYHASLLSSLRVSASLSRVQACIAQPFTLSPRWYSQAYLSLSLAFQLAVTWPERWTELSQLNRRILLSRPPLLSLCWDRHCRKDTSENMGLKSLLKHKSLYSRPFVSQSTFMWSNVILSFIKLFYKRMSF